MLVLSNAALLAVLVPIAVIPGGATALMIVYIPALIGFWAHVTGHLYKLASWLMILCSVVIFLGYAQLVVIQAIDVGQLLVGFTRGIQRILSSSPPITSPRWPYVPLTAMAWCSGALVGQAVIRRRIWLSIGIITVTFGCSYVLVIGGLQQPKGAFTVVSIVTVVLLLSLVLLRDSETTRRGLTDSTYENRPRRTIAVSSGYLGFAVAVAVASVGVVPGIDGDVVRPRIEAEVTNKNAMAPMLLVRQLRQNAELSGKDSVVMRISTTMRFINLASMRGYTGRTWSSVTRFEPTNGRVTVGRVDLQNKGKSQDYSVSLIDLSKTGGWIPYFGRPSIFRSADVLEPQGAASENDSSEKIVAFLYSGGASENVNVGFRTINPVVVEKSNLSTSLEKEAVVSGDVIDDVRDLALRMCQTVVDRYATDNSGNRGPFTSEFVCGTSPGREITVADVNKIMDLVADNRAHFLTDDVDRTGSESFGLVLTLMGAPGAKEFSSLRIGSPEQFSTAAALVLQSIGIPASVATGFRSMNKSGEVVASDAWTWIEIPLKNGQIAILDPTPETEENPESEVDTATQEESSTTTTIASTTTIVTDDGNSDNQGFVQPSDDNKGLPAIVRWSIVFGLVVILLSAVRTTANIRRRLRRRSGGSRSRMIGSWHNVLEAAYAAGFRQQASGTATEVASEIKKVLSDSHQDLNIDEMIEGANIAIYAVSEPSEDVVDSFVKSAQTIERALRRTVSPIQRLLAWALPMPNELLTPAHHLVVEKNRRRLTLRSS
jgi:hypothetical protein